MRTEGKDKTTEQDYGWLVSQLAELHPHLPEYFCTNGVRMYPIPHNEEGEKMMVERGYVKLVPDANIDIYVLAALYDIYEKFTKFPPHPVWRPFYGLPVLKKEINDKNSELAQALLKAYGDK